MSENNWKSRTELLLGKENVEILNNMHVLVVGLGGVGGYAAEQLCRAGLGKMTIVDSDTIHASNRNRQIIALKSSEGKHKSDMIEERLKDINPEVELIVHNLFLNESNISDLLKTPFDYVVDAIDTLTPKITLLSEGVRYGHQIISSMGSAGRMDPSKIQVSDISKSHHCKLASSVRKGLHQRGIRDGIKAVFSTEQVPPGAIIPTDGQNNKRSVVGTISYMPAIFGCFCAAEVIRDLLPKQDLD